MGDGGPLRRERVAVATLDGRAYYKALKLLKSLGLKYVLINPKEEAKGVKVILTTRGEGWGDDRILFIDGPKDVKLELLKRLLGEEGDLLMGIDPGKRIGFVAFYRNVVIDGGVYTSVKGLLEKISELSSHFKGRKLVRIGLDTEGLALKMAESIKRMGLRVELVDERGTTKKSGISRDLESAKAIAMRRGFEFKGVRQG